MEVKKAPIKILVTIDVPLTKYTIDKLLESINSLLGLIIVEECYNVGEVKI